MKLMKNNRLSIEQVAEMFNYKESTIQRKFAQTAKSIKKKYNVDLVKCKDSQGKTFYAIEEEQQRAMTLYEESKDIPVTIESLSFETYQFLIFLTLAASNQGVYRGTPAALLNYIDVKRNKKNIQTLKSVLESLKKRNYIGYQEDKDNVVIYLRDSIEDKLKVSINMLRECRRIVEENNKSFKKLSQLVQVWEAIRICEKSQPFTYQEIVNMTGLSYKQVRGVKRLLETNSAFLSNRAGTYFKCLGWQVELNGIYEPTTEK